MVIKDIIFYSNVHLGDLHLTRPYINWFTQNLKDVNFYYSHNYSDLVFADIPNLKKEPQELWKTLPRENGILCTPEKELVALNCWAYAEGIRTGCNYFSLNTLFKYYLEFIQKIDDRFNDIKFPERLIPEINYNFELFDKTNINTWFTSNLAEKNVFISNNLVESGQADNFNMNDLILQLAALAPNYNFYLTNKIQPELNIPNIFYNGNIIKKDAFDLNEQSYLSTFCDIIIGRNSGPFTFAQVKENLNKTWITMSYDYIPQDAFNWFNLNPNTGKYFHSQHPEKVIEFFKSCLND